MNIGTQDTTKHRIRLALGATAAAAALAVVLAGCSKGSPKGWQGYLEGDFVYVASPLAGRLDALSVAKGSRVAAGAPLFILEHGAEDDARRQSGQQLQVSRDQLNDLVKGSRPEELAALEARLGSAKAAAELSRLDLVRQEALFKTGAISASDYDHARLTHEADLQSVDECFAQLQTGRLGGRSDAVAAAQAAVQAASDAEAHAAWSVEQKTQVAPCAALVYDTLYRVGEFVSAGSPVVSLLPPQNIKVRFFVAEADIASIHAGDHVSVDVDGLPSPIDATVSYLSQDPEYTPPVLYNRDNRSKLVFMIEATVPAGEAANLHPGQPVDVVAKAQ